MVGDLEGVVRGVVPVRLGKAKLDFFHPQVASFLRARRYVWIKQVCLFEAQKASFGPDEVLHEWQIGSYA